LRCVAAGAVGVAEETKKAGTLVVAGAVDAGAVGDFHLAGSGLGDQYRCAPRRSCKKMERLGHQPTTVVTSRCSY